MPGFLPRPFSPTDAKRDREEQARLAERGDGSLWAASGRTSARLDAERAAREAALAENTVQLDALNVQLDTELPALQAALDANAAEVALARADIAAANGQIGIVQTAVVEADAKAATAQTAAATADSKAGTAQTAADAAAAAAAAASGIAAGKGKVLTQATAPGVEDRNVNTLWIDTTGGANTPKRWTTDTTWVAVTDKAATDAASAAATAQTKANTAFTDAQTALTNAGLAQTAADGKATVYYTDTAPSGTGFRAGDIWFRGTDNKVHLWQGGVWTPKTDTAIATAKAAADAAAAAASTADGKAVTAKTAADAAQVDADQAIADALAAKNTADSATSAAAAASSAASTADGKAVAAQSRADTAVSDAAAARTAGDNAAVLANSIVKTSTAAATGTPPSVGAIWNQTSADGTLIIKTWTSNAAGTVWVERKLDNAVIGNLSATKIDAGTLNAARLNAADVRAKFIEAGKITASDIVAGTLTSASGVFGTMDASVINAGSLNAARIAAGSIAANKLVIGSAVNGLPDPSFSITELLTARLTRSSGGVAGWAVGAPTAAGIRSVTRTTGTTNDSFHYAPVTPANGNAGLAIQCIPGQKWLLEVDVETDVSAGIRWNMYRYWADGTQTYIGLSPFNTAAGKRKLSYVWTVPAGCVAFELALACNVLGAVWTVYGTGLAAVQAGATLIEDGAITTPKIVTDAVLASHIKAGEITAGKLVAGTLTSASGVFGDINASSISSGSIDAARLVAGDIRAKFLTAGLVTAADMVTGTITAASGVIGSLDIGKVTTGELNGSFITAKSLQADKLLVSRGANLFTDPTIEDAAGWSAYFSATGGKNTGGSLLIPMSAVQAGVYYAQAAGLSARRTRVVPGGTYRLGGWVKTSAAAPAGTLKLYLRHHLEGSATGALAADVANNVPQNAAATVPDVWTFISGMVTIPESTTYTTGVLGAFKQAGYSTGTTIWSDLSIQQAAAGELIVDGAVTATKVATDAILANHIKAGEIVAGKLATDSVVAANIKAGEVTAAKVLAGSIGTTHMTANSVNADRLVAESITAGKLSAGSVTADKLEASLVLASKIVAGSPTGTRAEMNADGFRVFAAAADGGATTEVVRLGVASSNDYFAVTKADNTLAASISQDGVGSFAQVWAKDGMTYRGTELQALLDQRPRGIVAAAYRDTYSTVNAAPNASIPFLRLEAPLQPGRIYKVWTSEIKAGLDVNAGALIGIKYSVGTIATMSSGSLTEGYIWDDLATVGLSELVTVGSATTVSFLIWMGSVGGAGGFRPWAGQPVRLVVEDVGPMSNNIANGVHMNGTAAPAAAKNSYIRQYPITNSMNYLGNNNQYNWDLGHMYQGLQPSTSNGNLKSIGIAGGNTTDGASIASDLAGATVNYVNVNFNFPHWYYNSGGTARIGVHNHSVIPGVFSQTIVDAAISSGWPKPGSRWVGLPSSTYAGFKDGSHRGVTLLGDSTLGTYGFADRPTIEIGYTK